MILNLGLILISLSVRLQWDANAEADQVTSYHVYESVDGSSFARRASYTNVVTDPLTINYAKSYSWHVTAENVAGESGPSNVVTLSVAPVLTISASGNLVTINTEVFQGGIFELQSTTDFQSWTTEQIQVALTDDLTFYLPMSGPYKFFRLKRTTWPLEQTTQVLRAMGVSEMRQLSKSDNIPPRSNPTFSATIPPDLYPPGHPKRNFWARFKYFFRFRGAKPADEMKGAERLMHR